MSAAHTPLEEFTEWFVKNYPGPNTIISRPTWHAPKIFRSATYRIERELAAMREGNAELRSALEQAVAAMWDSHYGKGIEAGYAQSVDAQACAAIAKARA